MPAIAPIEDVRAIREEGLGFFAVPSGGLEPLTPDVSRLAVKEVRVDEVSDKKISQRIQYVSSVAHFP